MAVKLPFAVTYGDSIDMAASFAAPSPFTVSPADDKPHLFAVGLSYTGDGNDNTQDGTADDDTFDYSQGGNDTLHGLDGNDTFTMGAALNSADVIDGGTGFDEVDLEGSYNITLSPTTITNVELLSLTFGYDYKIKTDDATVASGQSMAIDGFNLFSNDKLVFDGSAETDGSFVVDGGEGSDTLTGGDNDDTLRGNAGNDTIYGGAGSDQIEGSYGNDVLYAGSGDDSVYGSYGGDTIYGGAGAQTLDGAEGNDVIFADHGGAYSAFGGAGKDIIFFSGEVSSDFFPDGGGSTDDLHLTGDVDVYVDNWGPAAGNFETVELDGTSWIYINVYNGSDTTIDFSNVPITSANGAALAIFGGGANDTLKGSALSDYIYDSSGNNNLYGGGGDDTIDSTYSNGSSSLYGGDGYDYLYAGFGSDSLYGGNDGDTLESGGPGATTHNYGGNGDDTINADHGGTDYVDGGGGADHVNFSGHIVAANQLDGGNGHDTLELVGAVYVDIASFAPGAPQFETLSLAYYETVYDNFSGNTTINLSGIGYSPNGYYLTIQGGAGDDTLTGTNAGDVIQDGSGSNAMYGLGGADILSAAGSTATNYLYGGDGSDTEYGGSGDDVMNGGNNNDYMYGGAGADQMDGGYGNDYMDAGSGDDFLSGYYGDDTLIGGVGIQLLDGAEGSDVIYANNGGQYAAFGDDGKDDIYFSGLFTDQFPTAGPHHGQNGGIPPDQIINGGNGSDTLHLTGAVNVATTSYSPHASSFEHLVLEPFGGAVVVTAQSGSNTSIDFSNIPTTSNGSYLQIVGGTGNDTLTGSNLGDVLMDSAGSNTLYGGDGSDTLDVSGSNGVNNLYGGNDNDTFVGGGGTTNSYGAKGDDTFYADNGGTDFVYGGSGDDIVYFGGTIGQNNQIDAGSGTDTLKVAGDIHVAVGTFDPKALGFEAMAFLTGGWSIIDDHAGKTTIDLSHVTVSGPGTPQITGGQGNDVLIGSSLSDFITDTQGNNTLEGGDGADLLSVQGGTGDNTLNGGAGDDYMIAGGGDDKMYGGADSDFLQSGVGAARMYGGTGNDSLSALAGSGPNKMYGGAGNDTISAFGGQDKVDGGSGDDLVSFTGVIASANQLAGGSGTDTLALSDLITLKTAIFDPSALGFEAVTFAAGTEIDGKGDANTIDLSHTPVTTFGPNVLTIDGAGGDDTITGGGESDLIYGGSGNNVLNGGDGNDVLYAVGGNDALDGGAGKDSLYGGAGQATLNGGIGNDTITANAGGLYTVDGGSGDDVVNFAGLVSSDGQVAGGSGHDTLTLTGDVNVHTASFIVHGLSFEEVSLDAGQTVDVNGNNHANTIDFSGVTTTAVSASDTLKISGKGGADILTGSNLDDTVLGGGGNDYVDGGAAGDDSMDGGGGTNRASFASSATGVHVSLSLQGGAQNVGGGRMVTLNNFQDLTGSSQADVLKGDGNGNHIDGGTGDDSIFGGAGADVMTGGNGSDVFVYNHTSDSDVADRDTITDFSHADHDTIDLSGIDADTTLAGDQAFHLGAIPGNFTRSPGELIQITQGGHTVIEGDVNGDGAADFAINLTSAVTLVAGDFDL